MVLWGASCPSKCGRDLPLLVLECSHICAVSMLTRQKCLQAVFAQLVSALAGSAAVGGIAANIFLLSVIVVWGFLPLTLGGGTVSRRPVRMCEKRGAQSWTKLAAWKKLSCTISVIRATWRNYHHEVHICFVFYVIWIVSGYISKDGLGMFICHQVFQSLRLSQILDIQLLLGSIFWKNRLEWGSVI